MAETGRECIVCCDWSVTSMYGEVERAERRLGKSEETCKLFPFNSACWWDFNSRNLWGGLSREVRTYSQSRCDPECITYSTSGSLVRCLNKNELMMVGSDLRHWSLMRWYSFLRTLWSKMWRIWHLVKRMKENVLSWDRSDTLQEWALQWDAECMWVGGELCVLCRMCGAIPECSWGRLRSAVGCVEVRISGR